MQRKRRAVGRLPTAFVFGHTNLTFCCLYRAATHVDRRTRHQQRRAAAYVNRRGTYPWAATDMDRVRDRTNSYRCARHGDEHHH